MGERLVITGYGTGDGTATVERQKVADRSTTSSGEFVIAGEFLRRSTSARHAFPKLAAKRRFRGDGLSDAN
jgi:hypothetical protein